MTNRNSQILITAVGALLAIGAPDLARAQGGSARPTPFPLNNGNFANYTKASDNLAAYMKQHPGDARVGGNESYDNADAAAKAMCDPHPGVKQAIASGGLSCSEYITFTMELEKIAGVAPLAKIGHPMPAGMGISPSDIEFYNQHTPEIKRVLAEIGAGDDAQ